MRYYSLITSMSFGKLQTMINNFKNRIISEFALFESESCLSSTLVNLDHIAALDKASLVITPNSYEEDKLLAIVPDNGSGDLTVVRATTVTRVNPQSVVEMTPRNLLAYSEQFNNAVWGRFAGGTGVLPAVTTNSVVAPNGLLEAETVVFDKGANNTINDQSFIQQSNIVIGGSHTFSVYVKATTLSDVGKQIFLRLSGGTGLYAFTLTANWVRIQRTDIITTPGSNIVQIGIRGTITTGNPVSVDIWGAQFEQNSTTTEYLPTVTRLNIPRLDYTNSICPTILVEPQRTNLLTNSDGLITTYPSRGGNIIQAVTPLNGFANSVQFQNNIAGSYLYKNFAPVVGTEYSLSCFIQMDDNSIPVVGATALLGDFSLIMGGNYVTSFTVEKIGTSNIYKVSGKRTTLGSDINNFGIIKLTTHSVKPFRVTGYHYIIMISI